MTNSNIWLFFWPWNSSQRFQNWEAGEHRIWRASEHFPGKGNSQATAGNSLLFVVLISCQVLPQKVKHMLWWHSIKSKQWNRLFFLYGCLIGDRYTGIQWYQVGEWKYTLNMLGLSNLLFHTVSCSPNVSETWIVFVNYNLPCTHFSMTKIAQCSQVETLTEGELYSASRKLKIMLEKIILGTSMCLLRFTVFQC